MNYIKMFPLCATTVLTAAGLFVTLPAAAKSVPVVVTAPTDRVIRHVTYADLNLASASGERTLYRRVGGEITGLCLEANNWDNGSVTFKLGMIRCSNGAWDEARPQISRALQRAHEIAS